VGQGVLADGRVSNGELPARSQALQGGGLAPPRGVARLFLLHDCSYALPL